MRILIPALFFCFISDNSYGQSAIQYKDFYFNGKLRSITHQGNFGGCGMQVGTDSVFAVSGYLKKTVFYDNRLSKTEPGCHQSWTTEVSKTYFRTGKLKRVSQTKYSYEGTPCNCGVWASYNSAGAVISKKRYSNCYDQIPCD